MSDTKLYWLWQGMLARCYNPSHVGYHRYGGRGIKVCDRWRASFENFVTDMGRPAKGMSLERENGDKDYEPRNVRWATSKEQARNSRRTRLVILDGVEMTLREAAAKLGINHSTISQRVRKYGLSHQQAVDHYAVKP